MKTQKLIGIKNSARIIQLGCFLLTLASPTLAQTSGRIEYSEKVKLVLHVEGNAEEDMINSLPKEHISQKELLFNSSASIYQSNKQKAANKDKETMDGDGAHVMIKMKEPDDKVYCDLINKLKTEQRDFMSRLFLVESNLSNLQWKLTGEQKMILNYPCQEALLKDSSKTVRVWFTPSLPISSGPNGYGNLPGIILEADWDNGKVNIVATKIELKEIDTSFLKKPKDGKKVTKEAFEKIKEEKRKEMEAENGGNGNVIIKIRK